LTLFFLPGGLPRGFFATVGPSIVGVSFLFLSNKRIIGDDKLTFSIGLCGNDIVFCAGKTTLVDPTNKDGKKYKPVKDKKNSKLKKKSNDNYILIR